MPNFDGLFAHAPGPKDYLIAAQAEQIRTMERSIAEHKAVERCLQKLLAIYEKKASEP